MHQPVKTTHCHRCWCGCFRHNTGISIGSGTKAGSTNASAVGSGANANGVNSTSLAGSSTITQALSPLVLAHRQLLKMPRYWLWLFLRRGECHRHWCRIFYLRELLCLRCRSHCQQNGAGAIGFQANTSGTDAMAIGVNACASGTSAFALGTSSRASNTSAAAFGVNASASGENAIAVGTNASSSGTNALAFRRICQCHRNQLVRCWFLCQSLWHKFRCHWRGSNCQWARLHCDRC